MKHLNKCNKFASFIIILFVVKIFFNIFPFTSSTPQIIGSDGFGYYSYLPSMFIYRDMSCSYLDQIDDKYYPDFNIPQYINIVNNSPINKYFSGVALLQSPFFFMAHGISKFYNVPADGYSYIYQYAVLFASLFYLWLALFFMRKLFLLYNSNEYNITACMIALVFATNLYRLSYQHSRI